jgi:2-polyprenyl-3-methyl-5-hydroxy-6-metoxy-1,4-benzoquinol methylase
MKLDKIVASEAHITDGYNPKVFQWVTDRFIGRTGIILDIGCSSGALGFALKERNPNLRVYGVEASYPAFRKAIERLDDVWLIDLSFDLYALSELLKDLKPELVVLADVLEHLKNPEKVLECIYRNTGPEITLCVSLPNIFNYELFEKYTSGVFNYENLGIFDRTHLKFYNVTSAIEMMQQVGFSSEFEPSFYMLNNKGQDLFSNHIDAVKCGESLIQIGNVAVKCTSPIRLAELSSYGFMLTCTRSS